MIVPACQIALTRFIVISEEDTTFRSLTASDVVLSNAMLIAEKAAALTEQNNERIEVTVAAWRPEPRSIDCEGALALGRLIGPTIRG